MRARATKRTGGAKGAPVTRERRKPNPGLAEPALAGAVAGTVGSMVTRGLNNPARDDLFIAVWSTGIGYADKSREEHGDFKKIAFLPYSTLDLEVYAPESSLLPEIRRHAAGIKARRGEQYPIDTSGHTITLGGRQNPLEFTGSVVAAESYTFHKNLQRGEYSASITASDIQGPYTVTVTGPGMETETQEFQTSEASEFYAHHRLDELLPVAGAVTSEDVEEEWGNREAELAQLSPMGEIENPTDKQVRYIMYLLHSNGYSTNWMDSGFKELGATMRERSGKVESWVRGLDWGRTSNLIDRLKKTAPNPRYSMGILGPQDDDAILQVTRAAGKQYGEATSPANRTMDGARIEYQAWISYNQIPVDTYPVHLQGRMWEYFRDEFRGKRLNPADHASVHKLVFFIENDEGLYRSQHTPILRNLATKRARGVYDHEKAIKLFRHLVDRADKLYHAGKTGKESWGQGLKVSTSTATRNAAAEELVNSFEAEYDLGNYNSLLPAKYQKNPYDSTINKADWKQLAFEAGRDWYTSPDSDRRRPAEAFKRWHSGQRPPRGNGITKPYLHRGFNGGVQAGRRLLKAGKRANPAHLGDTDNAASALYETFHGAPSSEVLTVEEDLASHDWLAGLGELTEIKFRTPSGYDAEVVFTPQDGVVLTASEDGRQLYLTGGNQAINLGSIHMGGSKWLKDSMVLGEIHEITYRTEKQFDGLKTIDYFHRLGEVSGVLPTLVYDTLNKTLSMVGGQYAVKPEGIVN